MELEFFGAAGEVTGSCHILRVGGHQVLLDCGQIQGGRDALREDHASERRVPCARPLPEHDDVRCGAGIRPGAIGRGPLREPLPGEHRAHTGEPGERFVGDPKRAGLVAPGADPREVPGRRHRRAEPRCRDRLEDDRGWKRRPGPGLHMAWRALQLAYAERTSFVGSVGT